MTTPAQEVFNLVKEHYKLLNKLIPQKEAQAMVKDISDEKKVSNVWTTFIEKNRAEDESSEIKSSKDVDFLVAAKAIEKVSAAKKAYEKALEDSMSLPEDIRPDMSVSKGSTGNFWKDYWAKKKAAAASN
jgi:hypothetical protein